jgi:hypothetical protein
MYMTKKEYYHYQFLVDPLSHSLSSAREPDGYDKGRRGVFT